MVCWCGILCVGEFVEGLIGLLAGLYFYIGGLVLCGVFCLWCVLLCFL